MSPKDLFERIMGKIQHAAARQDLRTIAHLAKVGDRVKALETQYDTLRQELMHLEAQVELAGADERGSIGMVLTACGPLQVIIDWPRLSDHPIAFVVPSRPSIICERSASETLVKFISSLVEVFGESILESLSSVRSHRGPLVSTSPDTAYRIGNTVRQYQFKPVVGTKHFLLTHSTTQEKAELIRGVAATLRISEAVHVEVSKGASQLVD